MADISASTVKELRERTGAGMMDCKKALTENDGQMEDAIDWLRKKGLSQAAKKSGRTAAEGLIAVYTSGQTGVVIEVNAETDFVSRNENFQKFSKTVAQLVHQHGYDLDALKAADYPETGRTVEGELTNLIAVIGENMSLRRVTRLSVDQGIVASYVHSALTENLGRVGVLVALESSADQSELAKLGKSIAMHIAAAHPQVIDAEDMTEQTIAREKAILREKAEQSVESPEIVEKMIEGGIRKFLKEAVLNEQIFMIDDTKRKVAAVIADQAKALQAEIKLADFAHFILGDGVEKPQNDFAAEVSQLSK